MILGCGEAETLSTLTATFAGSNPASLIVDNLSFLTLWQERILVTDIQHFNS